jgi:phage terminase small subunit
MPRRRIDLTRTPLDHMLEIMNSPAEPAERRDKMAIAAAPYVHARADRVPKKVRQATAAKQAGGAGTEWAGDLDPDGYRPQ